jgi:plasmid maintenance system antidote protein VapI
MEEMAFHGRGQNNAGHRSGAARLRLARFFGTDARSWVNLQAHYNLERAEVELAARVEKEVKPHAT